MKADFFIKEFNLHNISHAYLFECKDSSESHNLTDNFIKKILCTSSKEKPIFCDECKSCKSFNGNSNPDFLQIFPDDKDKICLLYTSPSPRDGIGSRMPSSA